MIKVMSATDQQKLGDPDSKQYKIDNQDWRKAKAGSPGLDEDKPPPRGRGRGWRNRARESPVPGNRPTDKETNNKDQRSSDKQADYDTKKEKREKRDQDRKEEEERRRRLQEERRREDERKWEEERGWKGGFTNDNARQRPEKRPTRITKEAPRQRPDTEGKEPSPAEKSRKPRRPEQNVYVPRGRREPQQIYVPRARRLQMEAEDATRADHDNTRTAHDTTRTAHDTARTSHDATRTAHSREPPQKKRIVDHKEQRQSDSRRSEIKTQKVSSRSGELKHKSDRFHEDDVRGSPKGNSDRRDSKGREDRHRDEQRRERTQRGHKEHRQRTDDRFESSDNRDNHGVRSSDSTSGSKQQRSDDNRVPCIRDVGHDMGESKYGSTEDFLDEDISDSFANERQDQSEIARNIESVCSRTLDDQDIHCRGIESNANDYAIERVGPSDKTTVVDHSAIVGDIKTTDMAVGVENDSNVMSQDCQEYHRDGSKHKPSVMPEDSNDVAISSETQCNVDVKSTVSDLDRMDVSTASDGEKTEVPSSNVEIKNDLSKTDDGKNDVKDDEMTLEGDRIDSSEMGVSYVESVDQMQETKRSNEDLCTKDRITTGVSCNPTSTDDANDKVIEDTSTMTIDSHRNRTKDVVTHPDHMSCDSVTHPEPSSKRDSHDDPSYDSVTCVVQEDCKEEIDVDIIQQITGGDNDVMFETDVSEGDQIGDLESTKVDVLPENDAIVHASESAFEHVGRKSGANNDDLVETVSSTDDEKMARIENKEDSCRPSDDSAEDDCDVSKVSSQDIMEIEDEDGSDNVETENGGNAMATIDGDDILETKDGGDVMATKDLDDTMATIDEGDTVATKDGDDTVATKDGSGEDSWDTMFDDTGDSLKPEEEEELSEGLAKVKVSIKKAKHDYYNYQPKDNMDYHAFEHVIEVYDFPVEFKTPDLMMSFSDFKNKGFDIKWVDDTHALAIFATPLIAQDALCLLNPMFRTRPISRASSQSKMKAKKSIEFLQPYRPRPETTAAAARRLVSGALGLKTNVTKEQREAERKKLREAKDKKRADRQATQDIWEGNI